MSDDESLLVRLLTKHGHTGETVATWALAEALKTSADARAALRDLLAPHVPRGLADLIPDGITWTGQGSDGGEGIPDLVGRDSEGRQRIILEGKFDADFQDLQLDPTSGYLSRLDPTLPGLYAVLAPARHLSRYLTQLLPALGAAVPAERGHHFASLGDEDRRVVGVLAWEELVGRLEDRVQATTRDIALVTAVASRFADPAWVPSPDPHWMASAGRQIAQVRAAIDATARVLNAAGTYTCKQQPWNDGFGWYVSLTSNPNAKIYLGLFFTPWADHDGAGPVWIQVLTENTPLTVAAADRVLTQIARPGSVGPVPRDNGPILSIPLPTDAIERGDYEAVLRDHVVRALDEIAAELDQPDTPGLT